MIEDILKHARKSKERAMVEDTDNITELRTQLMEQERTIKLLMEKVNNNQNHAMGGVEMTERSGLLANKGGSVGYGSLSVSMKEATNKAAADALMGAPTKQVSTS